MVLSVAYLAVLAVGLLTFLALAWSLIRQPNWLAIHGRGRMLAPEFAAGLFLAYLFLQNLGAVLAARTWGIEGTPTVLNELAILAVGAYTLVLLLVPLWWWLSRRPGPRSQPGVPPPPPRPWKSVLAVTGSGFVLAWACVTLMSDISRWIEIRMTGEPSDPLAHQTLLYLKDASWSEPGAIILILAAVIAAPLVEEVCYRGGVQAGLRSLSAPLSPWLSIVGTALLFSVMHLGATPFVALPGLFVLGVALGLIYEYTGRLTAPILVHAGFNALNLLLMYVLYE